MSAAEVLEAVTPAINAGLATCCLLAFGLGAAFVRGLSRG